MDDVVSPLGVYRDTVKPLSQGSHYGRLLFFHIILDLDNYTLCKLGAVSNAPYLDWITEA